MPLLVPSDEIQPGMMLAEAIITGGRVMMQGGRPLTPTDIAVLRRRYHGLSLRIGDPVLDEVVDFEDDSREREVAATAQRKVSESISQVSERFAKRASLRSTDFGVIQSAVAEIMEYLRGNPTSAALITNCLDSKNYLSEHTGNVFYLSMLLGSTVLDYVAAERNRQTSARELSSNVVMDLTSLGLGAMVMDLAMLPLQPLFGTDKPLSAADQQAIREHPSVAADMLPQNFSSAAKMVVRTHHENFDGSGYPKRIPADKLHVFTRIVRIADAYDAATSERVYRAAKSPVRVLWEMLVGPYRRFYDPKLMKAFCGLIQPFPIGAKLRLEDGRYAAVAKYNRKNPFKPIVVIAFDTQNRLIPESELEPPANLGERSDLRIKSYRDEDLSYLYAPPRRARPRSVRTSAPCWTALTRRSPRALGLRVVDTPEEDDRDFVFRAARATPPGNRRRGCVFSTTVR